MHRCNEPSRPVDLASLGRRIIIMGPSNAGKSTLAASLSDRLNVDVIHLDQLRFQPDTDWVFRSDAEFKQLHDDAVARDSWIIEGNYSAHLQPRLSRATGAILLSSNSIFRLFRYLNRTMIRRNRRIGALEGGKDSLKWEMVDWILFKTRGVAEQHAQTVRATGKPLIECRTMRRLDRLYKDWSLTPPQRLHLRFRPSDAKAH